MARNAPGGRVFLNDIACFQRIAKRDLGARNRTQVMMEWNEAYSVNNAEIDAQHQELISLLNDLDKAMKEGRGKQALGQIFTRLIAYTQEHFAAEEKLMRQHGYPGAAAHQARHMDLTRQVISLQQRYALNKTGLTVETSRFLSDWLSYHILGQDKKFGLYLKARGLA